MQFLAALSIADWIALTVFLTAWAAYEPLLKAVARKGSLINTDMTVIRLAWMRRMVARDSPLTDGQIVGNVLNSNSFFASSNLLLIAGAAGVLFNGEESFASASDLVAIKTSSRALFEVQIGLVVVCLSRGLLAFIWSIRQLNYCLAAIGAAPSSDSSPPADAYARAVANLVTPALSAFNSGVRGYYFAMAAAAWLFGPYAFIAATLGAVGLLFWRQRSSRTSAAVAEIRRLLEERDGQG